MRRVRRVVAVAAAAVLTAAALAVLVAFNLGRVLEAQRERLVAQAARGLARPLSVASVRLSYWPLGLRLDELSVGEDPDFGRQPFLESAGVVVSVRLWPLLQGRVEVAGIVFDRPRMAAVRDETGRWNFASLGTSAASGRARDRHGTRPRRRAQRRLRIPLEWVLGFALSEIRDGTIELRDRFQGDRSFTIARVGVRADDVRLGGRARIRAEAALLRPDGAPDTWLDLRLTHLGENDLERTPLAARLETGAVDLARVAALMGRRAQVGGTIAGMTVELEGTLERYTVAVDARAKAGQWRIAARTAEAPAIALHAQVSRNGNALVLDDARGTLGGLRVSARGAGQLRPWHAEVVTRSEEGSGLALPVLETKPWLADLEARLVIDPEGVSIPAARVRIDGTPVEISGRVRALAPLTVEGRFAARPFAGTVDGEVRGAAADAFTVSARCERLELAGAAARLAPDLAGKLSGRLGGSLDLGTRLAADRWRVERSEGAGRILLEDVRLHDVNVAALLVERLQALPLMPRLVSSRERARYPEIFGPRDTTIERATIPFTLGGGRLATDALTLTAGPYEISGAGWIDGSRRTRFGGEVTLASAVSQRLGKDVPAMRYLAGRDGRLIVPFRLTGHLGKALPEPDVKRLRGPRQRLRPRADPGGVEPEPPIGSDRPERSPDQGGIEQLIIERLERMLHP